MHNHSPENPELSRELAELDKETENNKIISDKLNEIGHWMIQAGLGTRVDVSKEGQVIGSVGVWSSKNEKEINIDLRGHKVRFVLPDNYRVWQLRSTDGEGMTTADLDEIIEALKAASVDLDQKITSRESK